MTRETKIGMIVAGSFLSLVGVVVGTKLYKHDLPENKGPETVASSTETPKKELPPGAVPANGSAGTSVQTAGLTSPGPLPPLAPPPASPTFDPPPLPPGPPAGPEVAAKLQETIGNQNKDLHGHGDKTLNGIADLGKPPPGNGFTNLPPPDNTFPTPPLSPPTSPPVRVVAQGPESKGKTTPPPGFDLPTVPVAPPTATSPNSAPPPPIGTIPPPTTTSAPSSVPPPPTVPTAKDSIAAPPPLTVPAAKDSTTAPPPPFGSVPPPPNSGSPTPASPPTGPSAAVPPPPAPIAAVPPITAPTTPTVPSVVVGDETRYVVQPGDTYASIAKKAYGDDRYATSLEELNRSRIGAAAATLRPGTAIAIPTAASLQNNRFGGPLAQGPPPPPAAPTPTPTTIPPLVPPSPPPPPVAPTYPPIATSPAALAPGQPVPPVPPVPPFAPAPPPPPAVVSPSSPPPPPLANRDPVSIGPVTSPNTRPATTPVPTGVTTYRIPAGGKLIAQVAQEQLGSPLRWIDIYRLNSNLDPSRPIPEGTEIRLPPR